MTGVRGRLRRMRWLALLLVSAACDSAGTRDDAPPPILLVDAPAETAVSHAPLPSESIPPRPRQVTDTLYIEGMPEPVQLRLFAPPAEAGRPPFSTYVPEDLTPQALGGGDTVSVRFVAAFGGQVNTDAYMHVRIYPPGVLRPEARKVIRSFIRSREPQAESGQLAEAPPWGEEAYRFEYDLPGDPIVGRAVIGSHGGRFFHVLTHYPVEYGDGIGPRFDLVLRHWRWEWTGRMLLPREENR